MFMNQAREVLLGQLRSGSGSREVVEGLELLSNACELVARKDEDIPICSCCGGLYWETARDGVLQCLSCDNIQMKNG